MKIKGKLTTLFISLVGFFLFFSLAYFYIREAERKIHVESVINNARQVIVTLLKLKSESFLKPVKDNAAWDEMIRFTETKDSIWAGEILQSIMATYEVDYIGVYDTLGQPIMEIDNINFASSSFLRELNSEFSPSRTTLTTFDLVGGNLVEIFGATIVHTDDIDRRNPPHGYLLMGKCWNKDYFAHISGASGFNVEYLPNQEIAASPDDEEIIYERLENWDSVGIGYLKFSRHSTLLADFKYLGYFTIIGFLLIFLVTFFLIYLTSRWIARPLKLITRSLAEKSTGPIEGISKLQDEFGDIARLISLVRQQTDDLVRRNAEYAEAHEKIKILTTAVEQSPNCIMITDISGNIGYVNQRFTELTGYTLEESIGNKPSILYSGFHDKAFYQNLWQTILSGKEWKENICNRKKNGELFWESTSIAPVRNDEGHITNFIAIKEDITERIKTENALRESREFSEMIYKVIPSAIFTVDNECKITSWNRKAEKITGFSAAEMIGQHCSVFAVEPCRKTCGLFEGQFAKPLENRECTIHNKSGDLIYISKNIDLLRDNSGKVIGGIESFEDITERKNIEQALIKAKEGAEVANKAKSEFLATMSHEIRTPMNGVIGMTELALTTNLTSSQRDYLQAIQTSAYLLLDTINDILDFSKIEAGKLEIEHVDFNIFEVVERSVEILTVKAFEKKIELLCEIEPGMPEFFSGDPLRIRQILVNFISNAVKFTNSGEIFISARVAERPAVPSDPWQIMFSVRDTGIGIAPDKLENIFDQFTQADNSTTRKYGGTGLGLSISKKLAEMMNGRLLVESEPGKGSTFSFIIPLVPVSEEGKQPEIPNKLIKKILVVDDNLTNLRILRDLLKYWNIEAETCSDGNQALELLEKASGENSPFDLVILDMQMPTMDGTEVARKIREKMLAGDNPIIFLHSSVDKEHIDHKGREDHFDHFLTKPVKMRDLYDLLHRRKKRASTVHKVSDEKPAEEYFGPEFTILIAEDNAINIKLLTAMLLKTGVKVEQAGNGEQAVELCLLTNPDLIFMDVHMPGMDGFQATRMIREKEGNERHTPIVALTAIALPGDRDKCLEAGMDDYLSKPFKRNDLFQILSKYLLNPGKSL